MSRSSYVMDKLSGVATLVCLVLVGFSYNAAAVDRIRGLPTLGPVIIPNPCTLPRVTGMCRAYFPRYYYDPATKECKRFIYGGCGGNSNSFKTKEECELRCVPVCKRSKKVGPCRARIPRYYFNSSSGKCEKFYFGGCGPNGNNFQTLTACRKQCNPNAIPLCQRPKVVGQCLGAFNRFFYNSRTRKCEPFIYGGCGSNGNNFVSLTDCQNRCVVPLCKRPKKVGPCRARILRYYFNSVSGQCETFFFGGCQSNGNNFETLAACQRRCNPKPVPVCERPKFPGPCKGSFTRFYFDSTTGKCMSFIYGGCQSNGNNFLTLSACRAKCNPDAIPLCERPKKPGPCKAAFPRFYFDSTTGKCMSFIYGGCQSNGNNFVTLSACRARCNPDALPLCQRPSKTGPCEAIIPRFYYNSKTRSCLPFTYGGCQSNGNNFVSVAECQRRCSRSYYQTLSLAQ